MDFSDNETRKQAWRTLAVVVAIIILVFVISLIFKVIFVPSLIGVILVVCVIGYIAYRIHNSKRQSMSPDVESGRT